MNLENARFNMVEQQIRPWDVLDPETLDTLQAVRRELFAPAALQRLAFADTELPLGHGAAMLPPKIEAHALQALAPRKEDRVLEVGTGSGFMAALLAARAGQVWSIEIQPELAALARQNLARAGVANVTVQEGNGLDGLAAVANQGPFDVIMLSGSVPAVPQDLLAQLKPGGRLFAIVGEAPVMHAQRITRQGEGFVTESLFETVAPALRAAATQAFVF